VRKRVKHHKSCKSYNTVLLSSPYIRIYRCNW